MICIYALYWPECDKIYIGQTSSYYKRLNDHLRKLKYSNHHNYLMQNVYDLYGLPETYVIQECLLNELNLLESYWCKEFNSTNKNVGLNISEPGTYGGSGVNSPTSKYSKFKILRIFSRLYKTDMSFLEVSLVESVNIAVVNHIGSGTSHVWLKEEYQNQHAIMRYKAIDRKTNNTRGGRPTVAEELGRPLELVSPVGKIVQVFNICQFCKENNLHQSAISSIKNKTRLSHKGWKLHK